MTVGVGCDILAFDRLKNADRAFIERVYTKREQQQAAERHDPLPYYCTRFAGKEAVVKAICDLPEDMKLTDVEILNDDAGAPQVTLYGGAAEAAGARTIRRIHISLSWEREYALAFAVAER